MKTLFLRYYRTLEKSISHFRSNLIILNTLISFFLMLVFIPDDLNSQSTVKSFSDSDGDTIFVLKNDGGISAGRLGNLDNKGSTSVALGSFPTASGDASVAIGAVAQALSTNTVALGSAKAEGKFSAAMGPGAHSSGESSIALGHRTSAIGKYSTAMGNDTRATGIGSTVMGFDGTAAGDYSICSGLKSIAEGPEAVALGHLVEATGGQSVAMGFKTQAIGTRSTAFGGYSIARGDGSIATGLRPEANGPESVAMGHIVKAEGGQSVAMGFKTQAIGVRSIAMGDHSTAHGRSSIAIGRGCIARNNHEAVFGSFNKPGRNTLLIVGNGKSVSDRSNALELSRSGDLSISGNLRESSDKRLKKDIEFIDDKVLDKLRKIKPIYFKYRNIYAYPQGEQIGLIAQEVQEYFPQLVEEGSDGYLSLSYSRFTAILLKGIQLQQREIAKIENKLTDINTLEKRIQILENNLTESKGTVYGQVVPLQYWYLIIASVIVLLIISLSLHYS